MTINALDGVQLLAKHHRARIRKVGELFGDQLDFEGIKVAVKIKDINKTEKKKKKNYIGTSGFGYEIR